MYNFKLWAYLLLRFYRFPSCRKRKKLWEAALQMKTPAKSWHRICSAHFRQNNFQFRGRGYRRYIKSNAVPKPTKDLPRSPITSDEETDPCYSEDTEPCIDSDYSFDDDVETSYLRDAIPSGQTGSSSISSDASEGRPNSLFIFRSSNLIWLILDC